MDASSSASAWCWLRICPDASAHGEPLASRANFNSAIGAQAPSAYRDKAARQKPVLLFIGPVYGHEVEGLTGLLNLVQILETGRDLRGGSQSIQLTLYEAMMRFALEHKPRIESSR